MNYRHAYMRIVSHAKSEQLKGLRPSTMYQRYKFPNQYFEFHHILPRSLFPNWTKRKSNIVPLTAREHFFCHQLLAKIYPGRAMYASFLFLCGSHKNLKIRNSRAYEENLKKLKRTQNKENPDWIEKVENGRKKVLELLLEFE